MKTTRAFLLSLAGLLAASAASAASAQTTTLDDVLARHLQALGGRDKIEALKTLTKKGIYVYNGLEFPLVAHHARDAKSREEIVGLSHWATKPRPGVTVIRAVDGEKAWMSGHERAMEPTLLVAEETADAVLIADFDGPLLDASAGSKLELIGRVTDEGEDLYQIRVVRASGATEDVYLGASNHLIRRRNLIAKPGAARGGFQKPQVIHYDDYRAVRDGSTEVELPERATVLVTEMIGDDPLDEDLIEVVRDARRRLRARLRHPARLADSALSRGRTGDPAGRAGRTGHHRLEVDVAVDDFTGLRRAERGEQGQGGDELGDAVHGGVLSRVGPASGPRVAFRSGFGGASLCVHRRWKPLSVPSESSRARPRIDPGSPSSRSCLGRRRRSRAPTPVPRPPRKHAARPRTPAPARWPPARGGR